MAPPNRLVLPGDPGHVPGPHGSIFFIGTATVLLQYGGFTILTDPNFLHAGDHVHLGYGLTSKRRTNPAMEMEDLPPVDLVLLSHLHEDHFDRVVARKLARSLPIVTTPHASRGLRRMGFSATMPIDRWQSAEVEKGSARLRVTAMPGRHGPKVVSGLLPDVMGSLLDFETAGGPLRMYISGDTLVFDDLYEIPKRFPDVDVALLHLGGTRILGVLVTMDDEQGVEALRIIDPKVAIPIHYDDYTVFKSPLEDFMRSVKAAGLEDRVHYLAHGETFNFDAAELRRRNRRAGRLVEARR